MNPESRHHTESDDHSRYSVGRIAERYKELIEKNQTSLNELESLYRSDPESEDFDNLLEDIAYSALLQNEEFNNNIKLIRSGNVSESDAAKISKRQKEMLSEHKQFVLEQAGIPTEAGLTDLEIGKKTVANILSSEQEKGNLKDSSDALRVLGILKFDEDEGQDRFEYPVNLFPESIDQKWDAYVGSVIKHLRTVRDLESHLGNQYKVDDADSSRRIAHNAIARDLHSMLGFDNLTDEQWGFDKTRKLVAKMRDHRFPTVETAESRVTAEALSGAWSKMGILGALATRSADIKRK